MSTKNRRGNFRGKTSANAKSQQTSGSSYGHLLLPKGVSMFSPKPGGKHKFDIIPYEVTDPKHMDHNSDSGIALVGDLWYKKPYKVHRNIGVNKDTVVCPTTFGNPCPICEYKAKRQKDGADFDEIKEMKTSLRNLYIVVPKGEKDYEEKPYLFDYSQFLFQDLLNEELSENDDNENFPSLTEGKTLRVRFISSTIGTGKPFAEAKRIDFDERHEQYDEDIMGINLDEILKVLSYKELDAKFLEEDVVNEDEQEDEDDVKPIRKSTKKVVEDEDDEDDEDDDDEPVVKKKPTKPTSSKSKRVLIDEDEEDEEDDEDEDEDEEEDDKPVVRKKKPIAKPTKKIVEEDDEDDEDADDEPTPIKRKAKTEPATSGGKCPHGHRFGKDCEKFDECDKCQKWDNCMDAKDSM